MRIHSVRLVIILGLAVMLVMGSSGSAFSYSEHSAHDSGPQICDQELVTLTDTSMVATWVTDEPSDTRISYGRIPWLLNLSATGEAFDEESNLADHGIHHYVELTNLKPGERYYYRVCSGETTGCLQSFSTLIPPDGECLSGFTTTTDTHLEYDRDVVGNGQEDTDELAKKVVEEINDEQINNSEADFGTIEGDLAEVMHDKAPYDSAPNIFNQELVTLTDNSMVVTWVTDEPSDTGISYGRLPWRLNLNATGETYNEYGDLADQGIYHYMELTDLEPGNRYYYRVCSGETRGRLRSFGTLMPPDGEYLFSFATMTDTHIGNDRDADENGQEDTSELAEKVVEEINDREMDFVIIKGDITQHALCGESHSGRNEFGDAKEILDGLDTTYYPIIGNHDIWPYDPAYPEYDEGPIGDSKLKATFGLTSTYYSFDYEGYRFICIDSVSRDPAPLGEPGARGGGEISSEQMEWLEDELDSAEDQKVMIFMHHPVTETADATAISLIPFRFTVDDGDAREFRELIGDYDNVVGVFSGHTHRNNVTHARETGRMPYPETTSTSDYPCGYNVYKVYTNGYLQSFYKCKQLNLSEPIRSTITIGGSMLQRITAFIEQSYKFGDRDDRNFVYTF